MKLIKFCKEEHNLTKGCLTIQLGTLEYYRKLDPEFNKIADELEGCYFIEELIDRESGKSYKNCKATVPNCYIFCVSTEDVEPHSIDPSYDSKYYIKNEEKFYTTIATLLRQQFSDSDYTDSYPSLMQEYVNDPDATIQVLGGSDFVKYNSTDNIKKSVKASDHQNLAVHLKKIVYTKSEKFCDDKEVRFAFIIHHSLLGVVSVKPEPKLLNINSNLLSCLS